MVKHDLHEQNRRSWNEATRQHNAHKGDQAAFLRDGGSTLFPEEISLLADVRGKTLLHLQCNAGQDTLSIASKLGAKVTGVDISDEAIDFARSLSEASSIPGTFIRSDIFDWFEQNTEKYDVVFTSYGATGWLSDLEAWGRGIFKALKPGGRFVMIEFHPTMLIFEADWSLTYDYMGGKLFDSEGVGDYVGESGGGLTNTGESIAPSEPFKNPKHAHEFTWGVADHVSALLKAGLQLTHLHEYPYTNGWKPFPDMIENSGRHMTLPEGKPVLPLMFSITAVKPEQ